MEQTPALARAIADGLGVSTGELRKLGAAGELTAERVVGALEKVAGRIGEDFGSLPLTVGQSITLLNNAFTEFIGTSDQASGATGALARAIAFVAEGVRNLAGSGETLRPIVEFVSNAIDGISRLFRIIGTGLAGYTLAIQQALGGDL
ncbi:tape measure protein, partial [Arthrospira platensis SPKY1]|nr:tape measure protein [Arthrospira platensis SPKY1]